MQAEAKLLDVQKMQSVSQVVGPVFEHKFGVISPVANDFPEAQTKHWAASLLISQVKQLEWQELIPKSWQNPYLPGEAFAINALP